MLDVCPDVQGIRHASAGERPGGFRGGLHLGDVLLADHMLSWLDFLGGSGDKDATALTAAIWLADISAGFPLTTVGLEVPIATCRERPVKGFLCILSVLGPPWPSSCSLFPGSSWSP